MMETGIDFASTIKELHPFILISLIVLGIIENLLFVRYGGKLKRGLMVWNQALRDDEWLFLSNLREDIVEEVKVGLWAKKKSFIMVRDGEVLIRYGNPKQNTSWPMVGYVDISSNEHVLEYRLPLFMLLLTLYLVFYGLIAQVYLFSLFMFVIFAIGFFMEFVGVRDFLAKRTDLYLVRQSSRKNIMQS